MEELLVRAVNLSTGAADGTFGTGGMLVIAPEPAVAGGELVNLILNSAALTSDGGIVLGVTQQVRVNSDFTYSDFLYKINPAGEFDPNFGTDGIVTLNVGPRRTSPDVAADPGGGFVVVQADVSTSQDHTLTRYDNDGTVDAAFGTAGVVVLKDQLPVTPLLTSWSSPQVQPDGKILIIAQESGDFASSGFLLRLNADGTLDTTFGNTVWLAAAGLLPGAGRALGPKSSAGLSSTRPGTPPTGSSA